MLKSYPTILAIVLSAALLGAKCSSLPPRPPGEDCLIGKAGCVCYDPTKPKDKQSYILPFEQCTNYVAMHVDRLIKIETFYMQSCKPKASVLTQQGVLLDDSTLSSEADQ